MSGLNYLKLGSTLSNICNTTQLGNATKCHHTFKNFWGEPCRCIIDFYDITKGVKIVLNSDTNKQRMLDLLQIKLLLMLYLLFCELFPISIFILYQQKVQEDILECLVQIVGHLLDRDYLRVRNDVFF